MKVIFEGNLAVGFRLKGICPESVVHIPTIGRVVLDVANPSTVDEEFSADQQGKTFLVVSTGLSSGVSVFGPFFDAGNASEFAEQNFDGEAWEVFALGHGDHFTEILQHRIGFRLRGIGAPDELDEASIEHIERSIRDGFNQGELCVTSSDGETEYRGWWSICRESDGG